MSLSEELLPYIRAGFAGQWILTAEPEEAQREITRLANREDYQLMVWDCALGIFFPRQPQGLPNEPGSNKPEMPLQRAMDIQLRERGKLTPMLVVLHNYHLFFQNPSVIQTLSNAVVKGKASSISFLILSPVIRLPVELEKLFRLVEHRLPTPKQIQGLANQLLEQDDDAPIDTRVLQAASGLTRREIEDACALSLVTHGQLDPDVIWSLKTQAVAKKGHLQVYRGKDSFQGLGGMEGLKTFTRRILRPDSPHKARGVVLLGPSGTGKTSISKALADETGRPLLLLDIGRVMSKHVGESEHRLHEALQMAEAMSPSLLMIDEAEKSLAGLGSEGDSGVASRLFGILLGWLQDRNERNQDVFVLATSNNIEALPPEFSRAERWDGVWFIDLPGEKERQLIWQIYTEQYEIEHSPQSVRDDGWTGAEIKSACRLSAMLNETLAEAAERIVPVSVSSRDRVEKLRQWARQRCLDAATGKIYVGTPEVSSNHVARRKIQTSIKEGL